jgi:hypothetical protein
MAGPSIAVRVIGDLSNFAKSMGDTAAHGEGAATRIRGAFTGALGAFNQTGVLGPLGDALNGVDQAIGHVAEHGKAIGPALLGVGAGVAGIGAGLSALGSKDQAAQQQLRTSIEATGKSYDDYGKQIEEAVKHGEKFGKTAGDTQDALRILTEATHDPDKALQLLNTTFDLSAAKHEDLNTAATQMGRTFNGNTKLLKEFGVEAAPKATQATKALEAATKQAQAAADGVAKAQQNLADVQAQLAGKTSLTTAEHQRLEKAQQAVGTAEGKAKDASLKLSAAQENMSQATAGAQNNIDGLGKVLAGQASASADTFSGKLAALKAKVEDSVASFGQKYGPAITAAGTAMAGLGAATEVASALLHSQAVAWLADQVAAYAAAVAENVALLGIPILIAAVVAGIAWMVFHWTQVKDAVMDAWNWIAEHWPLLLDILLGPIGVAINVIVEHFDLVKRAVADVVGFITSIWGGISGAISTAMAGLENVLAAPFRIAQDIIQGVVDAILQLIDKIKSAVQDVAGPISSVVGAVGGALGHIPGLQHGGIVTQPTLAVVGEAGPEAVIPLNRLRSTGTGTGGPAVVINNAVFSTEADVDVFMRQAAWAARSRAL